MSFDTVEDNRAFAEKFDFPYPLLCDVDRAMGVAYGACKDTDAKHPERITYIIDADGKVEWAQEVSDIEAHVDAAVAHFTDV